MSNQAAIVEALVSNAAIVEQQATGAASAPEAKIAVVQGDGVHGLAGRGEGASSGRDGGGAGGAGVGFGMKTSDIRPPGRMRPLSKADIAALLGQRARQRSLGTLPAADGMIRSSDREAARSVPTALAAGEEARVRIGASDDTPPDVLAALAADTAVMVRAAVAMNAAAPAEVDTRLARDGDERVRSLLARKVAALIPALADAEKDHLQAHVLSVLQQLVADEALRVREAIADVVKQMPQAPRELILRLAHDGAFSVSEPVIRLSPLLSTDDLLAILATPPTPGAAMAVARRHGLEEAVTDAIASGMDAGVITALLENRSAGIREATLDTLIARAPAHIGWHEPLTRRPMLSGNAVRALSQIVATHLLKTLADRLDLGGDISAELRHRLTERLQSQRPANVAEPDEEAAMAEARALKRADMLNERRLLETAMRGELRRVVAMLAVSAGVETAIVTRTAQLRNAKGLVSLVWKAGFSMRLALPLQALLAGLGPDTLLRANCSGGFPLAVEEMRWQLDCIVRGAG